MMPIPLTETHSSPANPVVNRLPGLSLGVDEPEHPLRVLGRLQFRIPEDEMETWAYLGCS